jgi:hypothetical protein
MIKIDVEGAEVEVPKDLEQIIQRTRPAFVCEILPLYDEQSERRRRVDELLAFLRRHDYAVGGLLLTSGASCLRLLRLTQTSNFMSTSSYLSIISASVQK